MKFFEASVDLLPERDLVELVEERLVEALADAVSLRALRLRLCVVDVTQRQVELVLVPFDITAVLRPPIRHDPQNRDPLGLIEWHDTIVQEVGRCERRLLRVELADGVPNGIRTRVAGVKGRCPRPPRRWGRPIRLAMPV